VVNFCEKCGFLLIPRQRYDIKKRYIDLYCNFCKKTEKKTAEETSYRVTTKIPHGDKDRLLVIDNEFYIDPTIRITCPKCGYPEAHYWQNGDRRKIEWEPITYYRCIKCKMTWND
jgi:DNA-directed RNA polymerase subunit M